MAMTFDELKRLVTAAQLKFFCAPDKPVVMVGVGGVYGTFQFIIVLEDGGNFLQFRTIGNLHCPADHAHLPEVLKAMGGLNYGARLVKAAWDPNDGEIVLMADLWVMDARITDEQFRRTIQNYMMAVDVGLGRLRTALETGQDPGQSGPEDIVGRILREPSLPGPIRSVLEKLMKLKKPGGGEPPEGDGPPAGDDFTRF